MPTPLLNLYAAQLPRLTAEESLRAAERIAVGTGSLRKGEGRRVAREWQRQIGQRAPVVRMRSKAQYRLHMGGLGIAVRPEPVSAPDD